MRHSRSSMYRRMASRSSSLTVRSSSCATSRSRWACGGGSEKRDGLGVPGYYGGHERSLRRPLYHIVLHSNRGQPASGPPAAAQGVGVSGSVVCNISQPFRLLQPDKGRVITSFFTTAGNRGNGSADAIGRSLRHCPSTGQRPWIGAGRRHSYLNGVPGGWRGAGWRCRLGVSSLQRFAVAGA